MGEGRWVMGEARWVMGEARWVMEEGGKAEGAAVTTQA